MGLHFNLVVNILTKWLQTSFILNANNFILLQVKRVGEFIEIGHKKISLTRSLPWDWAEIFLSPIEHKSIFNFFSLAGAW